jgi:hypothetical protein
MLGERDLRTSGMQEMVRVDAVCDVDVVAGVPQRVREAIDAHPVAAKAVRRIERGEKEELQRPAHVPV